MPAALAHASAGDAVALLALVALLMVAFRHLKGPHEGAIAVVAVGACLMTGATTFGEAGALTVPPAVTLGVVAVWAWARLAL